ncbi:MmcQ/YjbR family DNA-binding protein [Celerinatantimonas sp. MCCC 1A17872]|uniref:MmcQ/YjbR family DNA-binding protein n=1 Tax=Celerinatantimonas sp. MCCC 1A17872 TaxID=3177514 RepID=UPI0038C12318
MDCEQFNLFCSTFPATTHVVQWGNSDVWKVAGKVFAIGWQSRNAQPAFTFKTSDLNFEFLREYDGYIPAPYFASRGLKWIAQIETSGPLDDDLRYYLSQSYKIVASSLSKRKQNELGISPSLS